MNLVVTWSTTFDDPIPLPAGGALLTLRDAAALIQKLPGAQRDLEVWQTAIAILISAAEGRDFVMHARIAMVRALNHGRPAPQPGPRRAKAYRVVS